MIINKPKFWDKRNIDFFALLLLPISLIYIVINFIKNINNKGKKFNIPIICVGNIYIGGTGKTPLAIEIYKILKKIKQKPGFVKKYYKDQKDEQLLLKSNGETFLDVSRINAIKSLTKKNKNIAILDDGLQENKINYDLSIACFNEIQWIGNGLIIPAGPLRESLEKLKKINLVFINGKNNSKINKIIKLKNPKIKIFNTRYKFLNLKKIKKKRVIAFAGIGNPSNFFSQLKDNNIKLINTFSFPDHYKYTDYDLKKLIKEAKNKKAILLTTEKDFLRLDKKYKKKINFLSIKLIINKKKLFIQELKKII
tara:strand:+ start:789 stop:1718 length:930 start_codon:yes stop_codon:yes gene_type:complete